MIKCRPRIYLGEKWFISEQTSETNTETENQLVGALKQSKFIWTYGSIVEVHDSTLPCTTIHVLFVISFIRSMVIVHDCASISF